MGRTAFARFCRSTGTHLGGAGVHLPAVISVFLRRLASLEGDSGKKSYIYLFVTLC